jgi:hypothetical protein
MLRSMASMRPGYSSIGGDRCEGLLEDCVERLAEATLAVEDQPPSQTHTAPERSRTLGNGADCQPF